MSWLWTTNVIIHVDIVEQDKPTPDQLGRTLLVSGQEGSYEALDEIHARYAAPISDLVSEAASHRKFTSLRRREEVESLLRRDKEEAPESIPYRVSVSEHAQTKACLVLTFLPSKSIRREYIAVKPNGFELKRQVHATLDMLLVWFKRNYKVRARALGARRADWVLPAAWLIVCPARFSLTPRARHGRRWWRRRRSRHRSDGHRRRRRRPSRPGPARSTWARGGRRTRRQRMRVQTHRPRQTSLAG